MKRRATRPLLSRFLASLKTQTQEPMDKTMKAIVVGSTQKAGPLMLKPPGPELNEAGLDNNFNILSITASPIGNYAFDGDK
jgi:hypothetical protein